MYIHRSGRTGRVKEKGISLLLLGPKEVTTYKKLCNFLKKGKNNDMIISLYMFCFS
jgi:superfamily II DNA/RNA helicase